MSSIALERVKIISSFRDGEKYEEDANPEAWYFGGEYGY